MRAHRHLNILQELTMSDLISRALLCGLGLASLTKDAIQKTAEDLIDRSNLSEEEGRKLVKDLQKRSIQAQKALEKKVETAVHKALKNLDMAISNAVPKTANAGGKKRAAKGRKSAASHKAGSR
jgi:polyhydroxyalkanoate synthesis regulator phasin